MLNFLSKYVYKMQLYLRPFYNILRQQNNFEWNTEHQARFEEIKKLLTEQISITIPDPNQPFYAMCDASNFGIGAALLQSHNGTNKMNLISANSRLFTQAELRLSTLMRECTAIIYTLTELPLGLLGYCETNATISPIHEKAYRVNNILQLLDICQSTILNEELSINNIISNEKRNTDYFTKTPYFKPTFNINNYTENQQKFLTMFNFQHSQITQDEFEKLAKQLIKYSSVYATSKFDVGKISSSLHLPLKPDAVFKKQRASKVPIHLHDKVNRLLDILEQYNIISPVNKEEQPKGNTFINPVIILAKGESLKIVLDARYLNSLIDESKCNWPIEPIQVILTKINGKYFTTADMNSAYNQMPLDEQSRRLTQFVIGNQQNEFNRLFYGISIGPAAFSAFMSKIFRPLILKKNAITYLDDVFMQSQTKEEMFKVLEHYHKILQNENLKAAPDKSHFFLTRVKFLGHNIERKTITPLKSRIDAIQKLQPPTNKKKIQEFLGMLNFLSKYVYKMQLYLRPFYNILRQQNNFEWNTEHQARFEEIKKLLTEQISITIPDPNQPFYEMCDASNFGIGAALLQSHNGTNKMNLISANSRLFTQAELRLSTLMRECTAIIYTLTEYEFLILGSKHPTVLFTDHKPIIFLFTQKSNPNHRVYRFQLILIAYSLDSRKESCITRHFKSKYTT